MTDTPLLSDDFAAPFTLESHDGETTGVRGRIVRLGPAIDEVLTRHAYPPAIARLLGEVCVLAALIGASLKFEGRLILQAQGKGAVSLAVCDYDTAGKLRGYCRYDAEAVSTLGFGAGAGELLGGGVMVMTLDQGPDTERYQGVTALDGESLAENAEIYFQQSEQTPTRIKLAVGQEETGEGPRWRAGGMLIQSLAPDAARGDTFEAWETARAHFATIRDDELIDPTVSSPTLLYRLFHEEGARLFTPTPLAAFCRCSQAGIEAMLASFSAEEQADIIEPDGKIRVTCEYCSRTYEV